MSWWEADIAKFEFVNVVTSLAYAGFGVLTGDPVFAAATCWLALGSALFHAYRSPLTDAIDRSGMYSVMGYLVVPHWGIAVLFAGIGMVLSNKVLVPAMGVLFVLAAWRAWWAFPVFGLAYLVWNAGKRRWDDDGDPETIPWYARYCHGAWHLLTGYGVYLVRMG